MFTKPLEYIITKANLLDSYEHISKNSSGIDEVSFDEFNKKLNSRECLKFRVSYNL